MNAKSAQIALRRLKATPGNIIVVQFPENINYSGISSGMKIIGPLCAAKGCTAIGVRYGTTIRELNEKTMNSYGWYRKK